MPVPVELVIAEFEPVHWSILVISQLSGVQFGQSLTLTQVPDVQIKTPVGPEESNANPGSHVYVRVSPSPMSLPSVAEFVHIGELLLQLPAKGLHAGQERPQERSDKHVRITDGGLATAPETHVNVWESPMAVQATVEPFKHEGSMQPGGRAHAGQEVIQVPD